jgi:hypothetical protein
MSGILHNQAFVQSISTMQSGKSRETRCDRCTREAAQALWHRRRQYRDRRGEEDGILVRPATVVPVKRYTPEHKAEFLLHNAIDQADYRKARNEVPKPGLDPDSIPHLRPAWMERLFLDANVLFSASYKSDAGLPRLWKLKNVALCSSGYALEEARIDLTDENQRTRLNKRQPQFICLKPAEGRIRVGYLCRKRCADLSRCHRSSGHATVDG